MKPRHPFMLRSLPYSFRVGIALLVITLLGGYIVSGLHLKWHYDNRDEEPGLTMNDIIGAYHGVQSPSPLIQALETGHPEELPEPERNALLEWLRSDRLSQDYDNLDLGENAPSEIIAFNCLDCHTRSASGEEAMPSVPLEYWDDIQSIAYSKDIQPAGTNIVAMSQHAHAPSMAIILIVIAWLAICTRFWMGLTGLITLAAGLGLLVDMAGWWITRDIASFAYAVVVGGGVYSAGTSLLGLMVIVDCLLPGGKRSAAK
ncbi:MAG: hypothetical protein NXI07_04895 [bacterium]|nr:hypothetical protein [bacterium]